MCVRLVVPSFVCSWPLLFTLAWPCETQLLNKVDNTPLFLLYSGHDDGPIIPVLAALGVFDGSWPPYASMISLELCECRAVLWCVSRRARA